MTSSEAEPLRAMKANRSASDGALAPSSLPLAAFCSLLFVLELAAAFGPYGYYIDEPYYLACARRLDWGYVDFPPLSLLVLRAVGAVLGHSVVALRLPAALAGAATAFVAGRLARAFGGGLFAELTAAACLMVGPGYLILFGFFSTNAFEVLLWASAAYVLMHALSAQTRGQGTREFVLFGVILGLAVQNKHTSVLYAGALALGLLLSSSRRVWLTKGPWLAVAACLLLFLPNLIWQGAHHWISLEFYRSRDGNVDTPVLLGLANQALAINPAALPFCLLGLWFFLFTRAGVRHGVFAFAYLLLLVSLLALHSSRPDRILGAYPVLLAAGAVVFERFTRTRARVLRAAMVSLLLIGGGALLPLALPVLPPRVAARYAQALGVVPRIEREAAPLPEWLAERLGWPELVDAVANVAQQLSPGQRRRVVVLAASYDIAGAVELLGPAYGLGRVVSPHNSWFLWANEYSFEPTDVVIAVGFSEATLREHFRELRAAGSRRCDVCLSDSHDLALFVAREPRAPLSAVTQALRRLK